jgi:prepilin-type processing-associated H-X9-DG protein
VAGVPPVDFTKVTDGTSNTVMVAEQGRPDPTCSNLNNGLGDCRAFGWAGGMWSAGWGASGNWWHGITTVRSRINDPILTTSSSYPYYRNTKIMSQHTGGVHALLADGSVRYFSENINFQTWVNLNSRADGVPLGEF